MTEAPKKTMEEAQAYLDKHQLQKHFEAALQHVINEQPEDPLAAAAKYLLGRRALVSISSISAF